MTLIDEVRRDLEPENLLDHEHQHQTQTLIAWDIGNVERHLKQRWAQNAKRVLPVYRTDYKSVRSVVRLLGSARVLRVMNAYLKLRNRENAYFRNRRRGVTDRSIPSKSPKFRKAPR